MDTHEIEPQHLEPQPTGPNIWLTAFYSVRFVTRITWRLKWHLAPYAWLTLAALGPYNLTVTLGLLGCLITGIDSIRDITPKLSARESQLWLPLLVIGVAIQTTPLPWEAAALIAAVPVVGLHKARANIVPFWSPTWWRLRWAWIRLEATGGLWEGATPKWQTLATVDGVTTLKVKLAHGKHADAIGERERRSAETILTGVRGSAHLSPTDKAREIVLTLASPANLFAEDHGLPEGSRGEYTDPINFATDPIGEYVDVSVTMPGGIRHGLIAGPTGSGKSYAASAITRELYYTDHAIVIDGGGGASLTPQLKAGAIVAKDETEIVKAITGIRALLRYRQMVMGQNEWNNFEQGKEDRPEITREESPWRPINIIIDEAPGVVAILKEAGLQNILQEVITQGRKVGMRVVIITTTLNDNALPGGGKLFREQVSRSGWFFTLRPNDAIIEHMGTPPAGLLEHLAQTDPARAGFGIIREGERWHPTIVRAVTFPTDDPDAIIPAKPLIGDHAGVWAKATQAPTKVVTTPKEEVTTTVTSNHPGNRLSNRLLPPNHAGLTPTPTKVTTSNHPPTNTPHTRAGANQPQTVTTSNHQPAPNQGTGTERVRQYLTAHPDATQTQIAKAVGVSLSLVKKVRAENAKTTTSNREL